MEKNPSPVSKRVPVPKNAKYVDSQQRLPPGFLLCIVHFHHACALDLFIRLTGSINCWKYFKSFTVKNLGCMKFQIPSILIHLPYCTNAVRQSYDNNKMSERVIVLNHLSICTIKPFQLV